MKNYLILALISLLLQSCSCKCSDELNEIVSSQADTIENLELQLLAATGAINPICSPSDCPPKIDFCPNHTLESYSTCDNMGYDPLTRTELKDFSREYRDSVWSKSSKLFTTSGGSETYRPNNAHFNMHHKSAEVDSRFMDIEISELENYLCRVKTSELYTQQQQGDVMTPNNECINVIRFYYIRYPDPYSKDPSKAGRHSLALVPVQADFMYETGAVDPVGYACQTEYLDLKHSTGFSSGILSGVEDWNNLCPPFENCNRGNRVYNNSGSFDLMEGIILEKIDADDASATPEGCSP